MTLAERITAVVQAVGADVRDLAGQLAGKADAGHTHDVGDVDGLDHVSLPRHDATNVMIDLDDFVEPGHYGFHEEIGVDYPPENSPVPAPQLQTAQLAVTRSGARNWEGGDRHRVRQVLTTQAGAIWVRASAGTGNGMVMPGATTVTEWSPWVEHTPGPGGAPTHGLRQGWRPLGVPSAGRTNNNVSSLGRIMYLAPIWINTPGGVDLEVIRFGIEVSDAGTDPGSEVRWALYPALANGDIDWPGKMIEVIFPTGTSSGNITVNQTETIPPGLYWTASAARSTDSSAGSFPRLRGMNRTGNAISGVQRWNDMPLSGTGTSQGVVSRTVNDPPGTELPTDTPIATPNPGTETLIPNVGLYIPS